MSVSISFKSTQLYFFKPGFSSKRFFTSLSMIAVILCASFLVFPATAEANANAEPVAAVGSMSGDFEHRTAGTDKYNIVKQRDAASMKLYERDALKTPESVAGIIETGYGATIELKEKTEIEFGIFSVRIKRGDMWINYKRRGDGASGDNFKVLTPAGTIGIKGTAFRTVVSEKSGEVKIFVTEGAVTFTNEAGAIKIVESGFNLTVDAAGNSSAPLKNEELEKKNGAAPDSEKGGGDAGKNVKDKKENINGGNGKTGDKPAGEAETGGNSENKKPLQIEDAGSVNTEVNPFE